MRHLALRTLNPTHGLPCCCLQDTGVLSGSKVSLLRPPQSPSRAVGVPAWPRGCGVPRRGPSGAPVWSLRPDAASQRICAAGLSSRHVNQHSHKLCSLPSLGDCWMPPPSTVHQPRQRPRLGLQPRLPSRESLHSLPVTPCRPPAPQQRLGRAWAGAGQRLGDSVLWRCPSSGAGGQHSGLAAENSTARAPTWTQRHHHLEPLRSPHCQAHLPHHPAGPELEGGRFSARASGPSRGRHQTPPCGRQGGGFMRGQAGGHASRGPPG